MLVTCHIHTHIQLTKFCFPTFSNFTKLDNLIKSASPILERPQRKTFFILFFTMKPFIVRIALLIVAQKAFALANLDLDKRRMQPKDPLSTKAPLSTKSPKSTKAPKSAKAAGVIPTTSATSATTTATATSTRVATITTVAGTTTTTAAGTTTTTAAGTTTTTAAAGTTTTGAGSAAMMPRNPCLVNPASVECTEFCQFAKTDPSCPSQVSAAKTKDTSNTKPAGGGGVPNNPCFKSLKSVECQEYCELVKEDPICSHGGEPVPAPTPSPVQCNPHWASIKQNEVACTATSVCKDVTLPGNPMAEVCCLKDLCVCGKALQDQECLPW